MMLERLFLDVMDVPISRVLKDVQIVLSGENLKRLKLLNLVLDTELSFALFSIFP